MDQIWEDKKGIYGFFELYIIFTPWGPLGCIMELYSLLFPIIT